MRTDTTVLLYDPTLKKHVLQLKEGPWAGKPCLAELLICDNPLCRCSSIRFYCQPVESSPDSQHASARFALDVEKQCVDRAADSQPAPDSDAMAAAVASQLGEEGWDHLYSYFLGVKQEQIEECDVRRLDADFPPEVLRGDMSMVGYGEIFHFAPGFHFKIGSQPWLAADDYCVNPECACHEVVLQFIKSKRATDGGGKARATMPAMYYDYRQRTFRQANPPAAGQPSLNDLVGCLRAQWPGFDTDVRKRHRRLKALFMRAIRKGVPPAAAPAPAAAEAPEEPRPASRVAPTARVARNDPCPCGSGRKYKKRCGR